MLTEVQSVLASSIGIRHESQCRHVSMVDAADRTHAGHHLHALPRTSKCDDAQPSMRRACSPGCPEPVITRAGAAPGRRRS